VVQDPHRHAGRARGRAHRAGEARDALVAVGHVRIERHHAEQGLDGRSRDLLAAGRHQRGL
jgi:hypothetical protein